jgi:hypothetical protein
MRRRTQFFASGVGLALLAAAVPGLRLFGEPKILHRAGGVTLERVDEALVPHGDRLGAKDGDLMLSSGTLELVVGASSASPGRRLDFGAILDVTGPGFSDDGLESMETVLSIGGKKARLVTERVEPVLAKDVPAVRIVRQDAASGVVVTTDVRLSANGETVELRSRAVNHGAKAVSVRIGDDVAWPGVLTFVPGMGEIEEAGRRSVPWLARKGPLTYGLVFPSGSADVDFRAHQSETAQTCWSPEFELEPQGAVTYARVLLATRRGISEVARAAAKLANKPIGRVTGVLEPAPGWALLTAIASDGTTALKDSARDDGSFELALSPGRYTLLLQTPGGWDETVVEVNAGPAPTVARLVVPQAERLDYRITDTDGHPIPGRLIVVGIDGTPDPRFASIPRVSAAGNEVHSVTGEGRVDIPPGRYRVIASRGIEWSVAQRTIDVRAEQGVALRVALTHDLPTPGWISADLHLHAKPSGDSELSLDDRVASLLAAGVEFAVASDHNHVTDYAPTIASYDANSLITSTPGVEITTRTWGHFNAYPLPKGSAPPPWTADPPEMFAAVRRLSPDAVIQVNHPWSAGYGYFRRAVLDEKTGAHWRKQFSFDFDLVEVVNGWEFTTGDFLARNLQRYFDLLNLGRHYTAVGSSDSHKLTNEWAGYPRTYVRVGDDDRPDRVTPAQVAAALKAGHAIVSLGPFVEAHVGAAGPGDTVVASAGTVPLDVTVRSADWVSVDKVDVVENGAVVDSFDVGEAGRVGSVRWAQTVDVPVSRDSWIAVVVRGSRPIDEVLPGLHIAPFALTSPIYVDVDDETERAQREAPVSHGSRRRRALPPEPAPPAEAEESPEDPDEGEPADAAASEKVTAPQPSPARTDAGAQTTEQDRAGRE